LEDPHRVGQQGPAAVAALRAGVREAEAYGATVEAAVMAPGWTRPVIVGDAHRKMRMWSMAKPITALATRLAHAHKRTAPSATVEEAMQGALQRSENCRQRRVILDLQNELGGPEVARAYLRELLSRAGADVDFTTEVAPPAPECVRYLSAAADGLNPAAPTLQLGVSEWTVGDAVRFAAALNAHTFGPLGERVLDGMGLPKHHNREIAPLRLEMDPAFGAGKALAGASYKAGWGGASNGDYLVGQLGVLGDRSLAFAVMYHPAVQPVSEDAGLTHPDEALQAVLRRLPAAVH
jgi:hypothetical protein